MRESLESASRMAGHRFSVNDSAVRFTTGRTCKSIMGRVQQLLRSFQMVESITHSRVDKAMVYVLSDMNMLFTYAARP